MSLILKRIILDLISNSRYLPYEWGRRLVTKGGKKWGRRGNPRRYPSAPVEMSEEASMLSNGIKNGRLKVSFPFL